MPFECMPLRQVKGLRADLPARRVAQCRDSDVVRARAEAVGAGEVEELSKAVGGRYTLGAVRRELDRAACRRRDDRSVTQAEEFELHGQGCGRLIDEMQIEAVQTFVSEDDLDGLQRMRQRMPGAFGTPQRIDEPPAGACAYVLELPHEAASAWRASAAPFGEHVAH
jgi:hypothetical protein